MKINLGCGRVIKEGWINCDLHPMDDSVMFVDLRVLPLPFDSGCADEILLSHVLEHLENKYDIIMECHRVLKKDGLLHVKLPIHSNSLCHDSWYHQRNYFNVLYNDEKGNYGKGNFTLVSFKRYVYPCRQRIHDRWNRFLSWLESLVFFEYDWVLQKKDDTVR